MYVPHCRKQADVMQYAAILFTGHNAEGVDLGGGVGVRKYKEVNERNTEEHREKARCNSQKQKTRGEERDGDKGRGRNSANFVACLCH